MSADVHDFERFSRHRDPTTRELTFVAELSDLGVSAGDPVPRVVMIRGRRGVAHFTLAIVERDPDGDVTCYRYRPDAQSLRGIVALVIYND